MKSQLLAVTLIASVSVAALSVAALAEDDDDPPEQFERVQLKFTVENGTSGDCTVDGLAVDILGKNMGADKFTWMGNRNIAPGESTVMELPIRKPTKASRFYARFLRGKNQDPATGLLLDSNDAVPNLKLTAYRILLQ